jgi:streptomycin 6-kinase
MELPVVVEVPGDVARAVRARWPDRAQAWCDAAEGELVELCSRYNARPVQVMQARFGFVIAARTVDGVELVMRSTADPAGPSQARAARLLAEIGIGPRVHDVIETQTGTWAVMDQIRPGTAATDATLGEVVKLLRPLTDGGVVADNLPKLSDWLRPRLAGVTLDDMAPNARPIPPIIRKRVLDLLDELIADEDQALCHGDLSPGNVLRGQDRLMLIDPRGVVGDPEYDVEVLSIKADYGLRALAAHLRLDAERAEAWAHVATAAYI